jgi:selenocysteine lyase/cysteine desulfurase
MIDELPTYGYWAKAMPQLTEVRNKTADFIGAKAEEVTLTHSTTEGMNIVGQGLDLRAGDHVLMSDHEHPGGEAIWHTLVKQKGIVIDRFKIPLQPKGEAEILERLEAGINDRTRVVMVSHALFSTGLVLPVEKIAEITRRRDIIFVVDGAHPPGMMPVDIRRIGCDFYTASGHKWLLGPRGTGILYVAEPHIKRLKRFTSAYDENHVPADVGSWDADARRLNFVWTNNIHDLLGLGAAIDFHNEIGAERAHARCMSLIRRFNEAAVDLPGLSLVSTFEDDMASPMATLRVKGTTNKEVFRRLRANDGITVKEVSDFELPEPLNAIRVATHVFNSPEQVDRLVEALHTAI